MVLKRRSSRHPVPGKTRLREIAQQVQEIMDIPPDKHGNYPVGTKVVRGVISSITKALRAGEEVKVAGFGTFRLRYVRPKYIHNVVVGREFNGNKSPVPILIPHKFVVVFEPSVVLRALLNKDTGSCDERRVLTRKRNHPIC